MPDLSLRAYQRKIERWIEDNAVDTAISQTGYLIQSFPKAIQSWRCLSKALLQKQDFEQADQVFDVILRVDPDDFVAHIGKSMAAESRGNMDDAVEHMRRAFELQPGNEGLENEIKRLFIKKDGQAPEKIHLTRGALIKMYLRGSLFEQTIAEALIGISENPQRIDYQLALAEGYEKSGDFAKAVEVCVNILKELPFCQKANEQVQRILSVSGNMNPPQIYKQRLIALDPYFAYITERTASVLDVPDIAVMVEDRTEDQIENRPLNNLIADSWNQYSDTEKEYQASDWKEIIENALLASEPGMKFDLSSYEEVSDEEMNKPIPDDLHHSLTRREVLLERLRPVSPKNDRTTIIPEWIFDQSGELVRQTSTNESDADIENGLPTSLTDIDGDVNLGEAEIPVFTEAISENEIESEWISEIEQLESDDMDEPHKTLADTQEIKVVDYQPAYMLDIAEKAIYGENLKFAFATYRKLLDRGGRIDEVITRIEEISAEHPEKPDLLLFLGELYTLKGKRLDALAAYKKAQKNISL